MSQLHYPLLHVCLSSSTQVWSQALCVAMQRKKTLVQPGRSGGDWIWADSKFCKYTEDRATHNRAPFDCYFNEGDMCKLSAEDEKALKEQKHTRAESGNMNFTADCPTYVTDVASRQRFRAASMEYLFSRVSRDLVEAADQAAAEVFHFKDVPRHKMISVHVR